jgi:hypothetical protein
MPFNPAWNWLWTSTLGARYKSKGPPISWPVIFCHAIISVGELVGKFEPNRCCHQIIKSSQI